MRDGVADLSRLGLPGAEADRGDGHAIVELERARVGHDVGVSEKGRLIRARGVSITSKGWKVWREAAVSGWIIQVGVPKHGKSRPVEGGSGPAWPGHHFARIYAEKPIEWASNWRLRLQEESIRGAGEEREPGGLLTPSPSERWLRVQSGLDVSSLLILESGGEKDFVLLVLLSLLIVGTED